MRKFLTALALTAVLAAGIGSAVSVATPEQPSIHENNLGRRLTRADAEDLVRGFFPDNLEKISQEYGLGGSDDPSTVISDIVTDSLWVTGLEKCRIALARHTPVFSYQTFDPDAQCRGADSDVPGLCASRPRAGSQRSGPNGIRPSFDRGRDRRWIESFDQPHHTTKEQRSSGVLVSILRPRLR
jgi:hypothetical protein